jgi:hypothetical protein
VEQIYGLFGDVGGVYDIGSEASHSSPALSGSLAVATALFISFGIR